MMGNTMKAYAVNFHYYMKFTSLITIGDLTLNHNFKKISKHVKRSAFGGKKRRKQAMFVG